MKKALVVGGSNGIGLAIVNNLKTLNHVYIIDKSEPDMILPPNVSFEKFDLTEFDYSIFDKYDDIDTLMITAGFGHISLFRDIDENTIVNYFNVNTIATIRIIKHFYERMLSRTDFFCGVMVSISGFMSSPFFSVFGATKAALNIFIQSVNVEMEKAGTSNRILNVSPGSIKGTKFDKGAVNDFLQTDALAKEIVRNLKNKNDLFIPNFEGVFKDVLERAHTDFRKEGLHSYDYKVEQGRTNFK